MFTVVYMYLSVVVQYCMDGVFVLCICWTPETEIWNGNEL